jgi:predicted flap endonuclease-1-like 5' DNA nuclease
LRALEVDKAPAASSDMARRLEALEVELSTLASMRCPDPSVHRRTAAPAPPRAADPATDDDLTMITGVGPGLADVLRRMGYRTFRDIAAMGDDDLEEIARVAGDVVGPSAREGWVESARRLISNDAA